MEKQTLFSLSLSFFLQSLLASFPLSQSLSKASNPSRSPWAVKVRRASFLSRKTAGPRVAAEGGDREGPMFSLSDKRASSSTGMRLQRSSSSKSFSLSAARSFIPASFFLRQIARGEGGDMAFGSRGVLSFKRRLKGRERREKMQLDSQLQSTRGETFFFEKKKKKKKKKKKHSRSLSLSVFPSSLSRPTPKVDPAPARAPRPPPRLRLRRTRTPSRPESPPRRPRPRPPPKRRPRGARPRQRAAPR